MDCIHEADKMLVIDPEECIDCGACEPECPVEAITPQDAVPADWEPFVTINSAFDSGVAAVDALVEAYADASGIVAALVSEMDEQYYMACLDLRGGAASSSAAARSRTRRRPASSRAARS